MDATLSSSLSMATSVSSRVSLPASILDRSRMSLMTWSSCSPAVLIVPSCPACFRVTPSRRIRCAMPRMAFMGVRISWLMLARNTDFARLACSAASFASAACCWVILRWVMSTQEPMKPRNSPRGLNRGTPRSIIQRYSPATLRKRYSVSNASNLSKFRRTPSGVPEGRRGARPRSSHSRLPAPCCAR